MNDKNNDTQIIKSIAPKPVLLEKGIYIGEIPKTYWAAAITPTKDFITAGGFTKQQGKNELVSEDAFNINYIIENALLEKKKDNKRYTTLTNAFKISAKTLSQLQISNEEKISELCEFVANCFENNPKAIEQMRNENFIEFKKHKLDKKPGIPMYFSLPKSE